MSEWKYTSEAGNPTTEGFYRVVIVVDEANLRVGSNFSLLVVFNGNRYAKVTSRWYSPEHSTWSKIEFKETVIAWQKWNGKKEVPDKNMQLPEGVTWKD